MTFDLRACARQHRYRTRNLHDGASVPPARSSDRPHGPGYRGGEDRWDAIVGKHGYITMDGERLSVFAGYRSPRAKTANMPKLEAAAVYRAVS